MEKIKWDESLNICIKDIDEQKEALVSLINKLFENVNENAESRVVYECLTEITEFSRLHFAAEEKFLLKYQYPDYQEHRKEHREYIRKTISFRRWFAEDAESLNDDALEYLREWLLTHIQEGDARYAPFLRLKMYLDECALAGKTR